MKKLLLVLLFVPLVSFGQTINLEASIENQKITYIIETDIPLPIEVMIGLDARGLKPTDDAIGFSKRVLIDKSPIAFSFETRNSSGNQNILPSGSYDAEVSFYKTWGSKNSIVKKTYPKLIVGSQIVELKSYGSISNKKNKDLKQRWGMNVVMKERWDEEKFVKNLGKYQELRTKGRDPEIVKTYYFPDADMTFFVSKLLNQVLMWKFGKVDKL